MNTLARQSISKTLVKACTAAVLLVTCLNAQANSNVQDLSEEFRADTMHSLQVEQIAKNVVAPSFEILNNAAEKASVSKSFRNETLSSINIDTNFITAKPSLENFSAALDSFVDSNPTSNLENSFTAENAKTVLESVWANNIQPTFASFDTLDFDVEDAASNQVKLMTIDFAITALETARTNIAFANNVSL